MSDDNYEDPHEDQAEIDQPVGYGKPPVEHRFKKGISGNPKGRPRGSGKNAIARADDGSLDSLILREADRPVTIRDGDGPQEVRTIDVIVRSTMASAAKGDHRARKLALELIVRAKQEKQAQLEAYLVAAERAKANWDEMCSHYRYRYPNRDLYPHPDEFEVDHVAGKMILKSAWIDEGSAKYSAFLRTVEGQIEGALDAAEQYRKEQDPAEKDVWLDMWRGAQRDFDFLNSKLPAGERKSMPRRLKQELAVATAELAAREETQASG